MDDRRFDSFVRSLASGANRRQLLKGFLGIGGAAVAGGRLSETEAARRPTPTPKPVSCPGLQTPVNGECVCKTPKAPGTQNCGPDCCNPTGTGAAYSECCDNACCYGECYGEELCCPYPREFCEVSGECCPAGWTCCPDFGCIAPNQCCTAEDCPFQDCYAATCTAQHTCGYEAQCTAGGDCCVASTCYRSECQNDGACGAEVFDCTNVTYPSTCCDGGVCDQDSGECCTPLTCADLSPYACPAAYPDGCGGFIDCSDVCDDRLTCVEGGCVNTTSTCYASYCADENLGRCLISGLCLTQLNGSLVCVTSVYPVPPYTGACGECDSNSDCEPGDICLVDAAGCLTCPTNQGTGCGTLPG